MTVRHTHDEENATLDALEKHSDTKKSGCCGSKAQEHAKESHAHEHTSSGCCGSKAQEHAEESHVHEHASSGCCGSKAQEHTEESHAHSHCSGHDHVHHHHDGEPCTHHHAPSHTKIEEAEIEAKLRHQSGYNQSWIVVGMDCPSCASKLEKAILSIGGVDSAKVLFATEKLVVNGRSNDLAPLIQDKVASLGYQLKTLGQTVGTDTEKTSFIQQHWQILLLLTLMLVSYFCQLITPTLGAIAFSVTTLIGLYPITRKAIKLGQSGSPFSIQTLMTIAALGALYLGDRAEAAMVLVLFLLGEELETYASVRARSGVKALMDLVPDVATVLGANGERKQVSVDQLQRGMIIEVAPGGRLPADGQLITDDASFDESALTGESLPVERQKNQKVMAGALVVDRVVQLTITSEQGANAIDRILTLIEEAESRKAPLERFIDRFSQWYTPAMIGFAVLVVIVPVFVFGGNWDEWLYRGLTLLLIACPCALVISTPAAITSGLAAAARHGALIKGGAALEQLGNLQAIALDKTGTLTEGKPVVTDVLSWVLPVNEILGYASAIEIGSLHPLAMAVLDKAKEKGVTIREASNRQALIGRGVEGHLDNAHWQLLAPNRLVDTSISDLQLNEITELEHNGKTVAVLLKDNHVVGALAWRDNLREDSKSAMASLRQLGLKTVMLTGDNPRAANAIAKELGMECRAGLLPEDKVREVALLGEMQSIGMVGDGINDAPAMKTATIGIAMGGGTDVALETADAALTHNRLTELPVMIELSRATLENIRQNITLSLGLKGIFLITTLLGFTGLWVAVLADSGATALVTLNALRLLRFKSKLNS